MTLLTLPQELVEHILLSLATESVQKCRLVNRKLNEIIQSSTLLQYFLACKAAGVVDNPQSPLSYAERRKALEKREDAWRKLKPVFETTVKVNHLPSSISIHHLTEGTYFHDDTKNLHYCHLPLSPQDIPRWNKIPTHGPEEGWPGIVINFAVAVYEHDLIINVISSDMGNQGDMQRYSLDLVLLKFSTREYHPLARHPRIHVQRLPSARPFVMPRIVGDHLALVINSLDGTFPDKLFIFNWKTGHKRIQHETAENSYSDPVFVSPELLLVPNLILSHFEIWHIPLSHTNLKPPVQILSLKIPVISYDYSLLNLCCRGEPSPFLHTMPYFPPRSFFPSPENSIITVTLHVLSNSPFPRRRHASYTLIMHRHALLNTIQKCASPSFVEQREGLLTWLTNEVTVHEIADLDDGLLRLDTQSKLMSLSRSSPRTGSPTFTTTFANSGSSSVSSGSFTTSSTSRYNFFRVQWADWGPPISRWFQVSETQAGWNANSAGQRYAFSVPNPRDERKSMISVADFNPHNYRRNAEMMARHRGEGEDNGNNEKGEEVELEMLYHEGVFAERVYMGLKCVVYHAPYGYDFDVVLMDEERLLGLELDSEGRIEIKILYIG